MSDTAPPSDETPASRRLRIRALALLAADASRARRAAATAIALSGMLLVAQAAAIGWLLQAGLVDGTPLAGLWQGLAALGGMLALRLGLQAAAQWLAGQVADTAKRELRRRLYRAMLAQGPVWLRRQRSGELGELMLAHSDALEGYFTGFQLARAEVMAVPLALLVAVAWVQPAVALILFATAPLIPLFMMLVGWGAEAAGRAQLAELARMGGHFADRLKGLGLLRLYGRGEAELEGIAQAAEGVRVRTLKVLRIAFLSSTTLEFFASVSVAMVALYLGLGYLGMIPVQAPSLGVGMFCLLLAPEFYGPLRRFAAHYHDRANALAAVAEIERVLGAMPEPAAPAAAAAPTRLPEPSELHAPLLQVRGLALRPAADAALVVRGLDFDLAAGARLALVGASGSGKSTLLEALAGWLPADGGQIVLRPGLRLGYAGQRPYLFHGSIADNLRLADPQASDARLRAVAEAAQVMGFAARLPDGLDSLIGERGVGLSGGEARRIALARLLLLEPDLLLLDEPTAFLDRATEADLLRTLGGYARGRGVVVATHSAAVVDWADAVLRLDAAPATTGVPA